MPHVYFKTTLANGNKALMIIKPESSKICYYIINKDDLINRELTKSSDITTYLFTEISKKMSSSVFKEISDKLYFSCSFICDNCIGYCIPFIKGETNFITIKQQMENLNNLYNDFKDYLTNNPEDYNEFCDVVKNSSGDIYGMNGGAISKDRAKYVKTMYSDSNTPSF